MKASNRSASSQIQSRKTPSTRKWKIIPGRIEPVNRALVVGETGWWSAFPRGRWAPVPAPPGEVAALEIAHAVDGYVIAATSSGLYAAAATDLDDKQGAAQAFDADAGPVWRALWSGAAVEALTIGDTFALALPGSAFKRKGDVWTFSENTAERKVRVVVDFLASR